MNDPLWKQQSKKLDQILFVKKTFWRIFVRTKLSIHHGMIFLIKRHSYQILGDHLQILLNTKPIQVNFFTSINPEIIRKP